MAGIESLSCSSPEVHPLGVILSLLLQMDNTDNLMNDYNDIEARTI